MAVAVEMPKLGNTVEECLIAEWLKQEGQTVSAGETVVEIETDKTSFEVTAPVDGTVLATFFERARSCRCYNAICDRQSRRERGSISPAIERVNFCSERHGRTRRQMQETPIWGVGPLHERGLTLPCPTPQRH